ncbi:MAG: ABC transporter substrate-binding protein, partial [Alphaproteobacteria bacterium]
MTVEFSRRDMLRFGALSGLVSIVGIGPIRQALAEGRDTLTIAYPGDVPTWDPNARTHFLAHPLFRCVFDQPLTLTPDLKTAPSVITKWQWQDNGTSLHLDFRSDVMWHTGEPFTAEDFKFTYFDRLKAQGTVRLDIAGVWRLIKEIEVVSPTKAIMRFTQPMPSAIAWLSFLANFLVPKAYITKVGYEEFVKKPMGSGPFKIAEYTQGARIALEANDKYWGVKSPFKRVTFEIVRDASARVAAIEAKRVDIAAEIPVREAVRLSKVPGIASRIDPSADIVIIHIMNSGPFTDERVRLAAHHA